MVCKLFVGLCMSLLWQELIATKISGLEDEPTGSWNLTTTDILRRTLLPGYDRWSRPANVDEITPVKFSLRARHVSIDERKSTATLVGWMKLLWHDNKLRWNASEYAGVDVIHVSSDEIWKPDLELYNAAKPVVVEAQARILLYADGTVLWVPPFRFDVFCKLNLKSWPRDSQTCRFIIGSWTHHTMLLDVTFDEKGAFDKDEISWDVMGGRWKIGEVQTEHLVQYYNCCAEPYSSLQYDITVERLGGAHVIINEVPVVTLVVLLAAAAIREPAPRGLLLVAVALISSIYLVSLTIQIPSMVDSLPRIAAFYCGLLGLAAVWGVTSAVAERLSKSNNQKPVPEALKRFVKKSQLNIANEGAEVAISPDGDKTVDSSDDSWCKLATLFDRIFIAIGAVGLALIFVLNF